MTLEEAIKTAIIYETKVRDIYEKGAKAIVDPRGRRFFETLGKDEQVHLDYLNHQFEHWRRTGKLSEKDLEGTVPPASRIEAEADKLDTRMQRDDRGMYQQMLSKALAMEVETSRFYREMVQQMQDDYRRMFTRFMEIEDNHVKAVQFELDYIAQTGYWFGVKEFDME